MRTKLCLPAIILALTVQTSAETPSAETKAAMQELWRRGHCLLSSVLKPAAKEAVIPRDIGNTPVIVPRLRAAVGKLLCYAADGATIWTADDQSLYRVDAAAGKLVKRYDLSDGLGDAAIRSIAVSGDTVWMATRSGLFALDVKGGRCACVDDIRFSVGWLAAGTSGVWLVSDGGVYRLPSGQTKWRKLPGAPAIEALASVSKRGFWWARWRVWSASKMPQVFATVDGLYAICLGRLIHYPASGGGPREISDKTWRAVAQERKVWALTTGGIVRYDAETGKTDRFTSGAGMPSGRPVALAVGESAVFVAAEADYDSRRRRFTGGGIGRMDLSTGKWTVTEKVGQTSVRFVTALLVDGKEAWAACTLYDRVVQLGAHPGMAHVKRYRPNVSGLAMLHFDGDAWRVMSLDRQKPDRRWVLGQRGTFAIDSIVPKRLDSMWMIDDDRGRQDRLWGVFRMVPERYYSGYYISAGLLAVRSGGAWQGKFDIRTGELALGGEQPELMLISHSHGARLVLADGHPVVLGIESIGKRTWAVCESGLFVRSAAGRFTPVVRTAHRAYWRVTAGAAGKHAVWFGGDGGTISRLDRKTGRLELVGVSRGRKILAITVTGDAGKDDAVVVRTGSTKAVLPVSLASAPGLPGAETIAFDGVKWKASDKDAPSAAMRFSCQKRGDYVYRGGKRVAFVKGVFRPIMLCEDTLAGKLWLGTYSGVAGIPLPDNRGQ